MDSKKVDREIYNTADGDFYHSSQSARAMFYYEVNWLSSFLPATMSTREFYALEIGCGEGSNFDWLGKHGYFCIGIDHARRSIIRASKKYGDLNSFAVLLADAEAPPFKENAIDAIMCASILHHLPDYTKSLESLYHCLRSGGVIVTSEPCAYNPFAVIRRKYFPSVYHTPTERPFPPEEIIAEFKKRFEKVYFRRQFLFAINSSFVEKLLGQRWAELYLRLILPIDNLLLKIPFIKQLCWRIDIVGIKKV